MSQWMKRSFGFVLLVLLIVLVFHNSLFTPTHATENGRKADASKWEYLAIQYQNVEDLVSKANAAGKEGWELATMGTCTCVSGVAYFKRRSP